MAKQTHRKYGIRRYAAVLLTTLNHLIVTKINYNDLIVGDKNAIMVAARILGYGKDYKFQYDGEEHIADLTELLPTNLDEETLIEKGVNKFKFTMPSSETQIEFKLLTGKDDADIKKEIKGLQKIDKKVTPELSTRLKYMILSVNGDESKATIREYVDNYCLARDSRAFRKHIRSFQPDINLSFNLESTDGIDKEVSLPMTVTFFWPDSNI